MKPLLFVALSLILAGCKPVVGPEKADAPPSLEQKYRDYILGSSKGWNAVSIELDWKPMLDQFKNAVTRSQKLDLSLGRDTLYRGTKAPRAEQALLKSIFNSYLLSLSLAYQVEGPVERPNPFFQSLEIKELILKQLDYLYSRGFSKGHFIGPVKNEPCPPDVADFFRFELRLSGYCTTLYLMKEELKETGVFEKYLETLRYICRPEKVHRHYHAEHRGYYNSDAARNVVDRLIPFALATDDPSEKEQVLQYVREAMEVSCSVVPGWIDTIKPDGSGFHHRGIYGAAYTTGFINETAFGLYLLANTPHQSDLQLYKDFELLMDAFAFYAEQLPFGLRGRMPLKESGIPGSLHGYLLAASTPDGFYENAKPRYARLAQKYPLSLEGGRGKVLRGAGFPALADALESEVTEPAPQGVRVFPYGALMVQRTPEWTASVKGFSKYAWDYEASPTENVHGQYLSYGVLNIFNGEEVGHDFENGWDWARMPGATAVHYPIAEVDGRPPARRMNSRTFVGGVELDDEVGLFAMDFEDAPFPNQPLSTLSAKKSWFFFGDHIIALGSGITRSVDAHEVKTTLFQAKLEEGVVAPKGNWLADSVGNGYYIPEGQKLMVTSGLQKSRSHDDKAETAGEYVTAVINHGVSPQGASYEYVVCPGIENKTNVADSYKVIQQNDAAHIVEDLESGTAAAALFSEYKADAGLLAAVDQPALILLQEKEAGRLALSVANPDLGLAEPDEEISFGVLLDEEFARRESRVLPVRVTLAGDWNLAGASDAAAIVEKSAGQTVVEFQCRHGMGIQMELVQNKGALEGDSASLSLTKDKGEIQYYLLDGRQFGLKTTLQFEAK